MTLINYNSVRTLREICGRSAVYLTRKKGFTAPEEQKRIISEIPEWSDLYSMTAVPYKYLNREDWPDPGYFQYPLYSCGEMIGMGRELLEER